MKVDCLHGYFKFYDDTIGQINHFVSLYGLPIVRSNDHFTFEALVDAPDYSIEGGLYLGALSTKTFEGDPWEVMKENKLVYNFNLSKVVRIETITDAIVISPSVYFFLSSSGMIQPGSVTEDGLRVTDYSASYSFERPGFRYVGVSYV